MNEQFWILGAIASAGAGVAVCIKYVDGIEEKAAAKERLKFEENENRLSNGIAVAKSERDIASESQNHQLVAVITRIIDALTGVVK